MLKNNRMKSALVLILSLILLLVPTLSAAGQAEGMTKIQSNELVVNTLDDQGQVSDIKVLSHLRAFGTGSSVIEENTAYKLSSVRNLYGKEKIQLADGKLKVNMNVPSGKEYNDVYCLSTLDKEAVKQVKMPVAVKVKYSLDGKEMTVAALAGKSGHLKITCEMENLTGTKRTLEFKDNKGQDVKTEATVYTPYIVSLSNWEFDNKLYSHINAPGVAQQSPEGVVVDAQGKTTVSWNVPLVPPKYPAKQFTTLEADAKNIKLNSFKIAVLPIVPTTSEIDSLGTIQDSFSKLYDAFGQIGGGIGSPSKDATLLFGLTSVKKGVNQMSDALGTLIDKMKQIRYGLSNSSFDASSFNSAAGTDAKGNKPGVREAISMSKGALDSKMVPAFEGQKMVLTGLETFIGKPGAAPVAPSAATSVYNDVNYLKGLLAGTPAEAVINQAINPKLVAIGTNVTVLRDGGTLITPTGAQPFPASVNAVETGTKQISEALAKANSGIGMIALGVGSFDANGKPSKLMIDGKPGTLVYALYYLQSSMNGQLVPGVDKIMDGTAKIGEGTVTAQNSISKGLNTFASVPLITSALKDNAAQANTFLGKPDGAEATVAYIYQTPKVDAATKTMNYGLGAIALMLILLFIFGRPPKQMIQSQSPDVKA